MPTETEIRWAASEWLRPLLPGYAKDYATVSGIAWDALLKEPRMAMYSAGEKSAIALAAVLEDRIGVVREVIEHQHSAQSLISNLSYLTMERRRAWIALLILKSESLPE